MREGGREGGRGEHDGGAREGDLCSMCILFITMDLFFQFVCLYAYLQSNTIPQNSTVQRRANTHPTTTYTAAYTN